MALSSAIAAGDPDPIATSVKMALRGGAAREEVYEALLQSYLFLGFPRAIEAFFAAGPVLRKHKAVPPPAGPVDPAGWVQAGEALCHRVYGRNYGKLVETMGELSPDLASWMILTTTRMWRQLRSHAIGAVNVGGTRARVRESIALCAPTAGAATVSEALRVAGLESQDARG